MSLTTRWMQSHLVIGDHNTAPFVLRLETCGLVRATVPT